MSASRGSRVRYEWDKKKEDENIKKHGLDFETATLIWESITLTELDGRFDYGEERFVAVGEVDERAIAVVFTWRQANRRIISARKASRDERKRYYDTCARGEADPPD